MTVLTDLIDGKIRLWIAFWLVYLMNTKTISYLAYVALNDRYWIIAVPYAILATLTVIASADNYNGSKIWQQTAKLLACAGLALLFITILN